jgi:hypothetical protein
MIVVTVLDEDEGKEDAPFPADRGAALAPH